MPLASHFTGDYHKLKRAARHSADWKTAYDALHQSGCPPDPEREWKRLEDIGVRLILFGDDEYPAILREIPNPPFGIYVLGTLPTDALSVAIVGTRRGTPDGKATARNFAAQLSAAGFIITSGLALGIDAAGHEGCLEANGKTVAVLAGGLDSVYPHTNEKLARRILQAGGALVSEYPLHEPPYGYRFLERNRIVSGLSKGVLLVECPKRSGSLATAYFAVKQNRDVFIVPGPITHSNFFGSHQLIRQGAELVTAPEDILEAYGLIEKESFALDAMAANDEEKQILIALRSASDALSVDKIIEMTKLEARIVNQALSFLLIKNVIKETEVGYIIE